MFGIHDLALFVAAGLLLNMTPGPDTLYIVGRSVSQGRAAGAIAALGIGAGCLIHIVAAALGLSAILASSSLAYGMVKYAGAAYLVYLGIRALLPWRQTPATVQQSIAAASRRVIFRQAFLTNVMNPKVALFFMAFLPQFVNPDAAGQALPLLLLGLLFNCNGTLWNLLIAWSAASLTASARRSGRLTAWLRRATGAMFVGLGVRLALSDR